MQNTESKFLLVKVSGFSMSPFLKDGQKVLVSKVLIKDLNIGDIILYQSDSGQKVAHRLIKMIKANDGMLFYTRGDASVGPAECITSDRLIGKVSGILKEDRIIILGTGLRPVLNWFLAKVYPGIRMINILGVKIITLALMGFKYVPLYRNFLREIFYNKINCRILSDAEDNFIKLYKPEKIINQEYLHAKDKDSAGLKRIYFVCLWKSEFIGMAELLHADPGSFYPGLWIYGLQGRQRFWIMPAAEKLICAILDYAKENSINKLNLFIDRQQRFPLFIYKMFGFKIVDRFTVHIKYPPYHKLYLKMQRQI